MCRCRAGKCDLKQLCDVLMPLLSSPACRRLIPATPADGGGAAAVGWQQHQRGWALFPLPAVAAAAGVQAMAFGCPTRGPVAAEEAAVPAAAVPAAAGAGHSRGRKRSLLAGRRQVAAGAGLCCPSHPCLVQLGPAHSCLAGSLHLLPAAHTCPLPGHCRACIA